MEIIQKITDPWNKVLPIDTWTTNTLLHCKTFPCSRYQLVYLSEGTVDSEVATLVRSAAEANGVLSCGQAVGQEA